MTHRATADGLSSTFVVENRGNLLLPLSLGAYPGFALLTSPRTGWSVRFSEAVASSRIRRAIVCWGLQVGRCADIDLRSDKLADGAIHIGNVAGRTVTVVNLAGENALSLRPGRSPWFALWSVPGADLLRLEPLHGTTDAPDAMGNIVDKRAANR